ncbi:hypothetical protein [Bowmanella sp. JS7-9]|uniref:Uncharacterized protein n=1 Tax=Pseudobowmanella zhangzhouensis TaxID=1537679 RepID=A0ABW1XGC4_9ALTE|nr:hypothetical protein [Bowmanella sp. JS7-9]TBX24574.1 hypothetical protein TK45_04710 [Bowmanella sp. JS7-9]
MLHRLLLASFAVLATSTPAASLPDIQTDTLQTLCISTRDHQVRCIKPSEQGANARVYVYPLVTRNVPSGDDVTCYQRASLTVCRPAAEVSPVLTSLLTHDE